MAPEGSTNLEQPKVFLTLDSVRVRPLGGRKNCNGSFLKKNW